jgi:4'-phosphopantetheinyl transferase
VGEAKRLAIDAPFTLWSVDLSRDPQPQDIALLSSEEHRRAARFRFNRDRRRYVVAHAALRRLLMENGAPHAGKRAFLANQFGKPQLDSQPSPDFSISYAGDLALIGLSNSSAIGVDVETLRPIRDEDITSDVFDDSERAALGDERPGADRGGAFLRAWTRKEACVKAIGTGLSTPPSDVVVGTRHEVTQLMLVCGSVSTPVEVGSFQLGPRIAAWARVL